MLTKYWHDHEVLVLGLLGWIVMGPFVKILVGGFGFSSEGIWLSAWLDT
jgi:hypothetical protein